MRFGEKRYIHSTSHALSSPLYLPTMGRYLAANGREAARCRGGAKVCRKRDGGWVGNRLDRGFFLRALAAAIKSKQLLDIRGVPTSKQSERRAIELGIPLTTLAEHPRPNVTIDGADEVAPNLDLIKGLAERCFARRSSPRTRRKLVIIGWRQQNGAKAGFQIDAAGRGGAIRATKYRSRFCGRWRAAADVRRTPAGEAFITDNDNLYLRLPIPRRHRRAT